MSDEQAHDAPSKGPGCFFGGLATAALTLLGGALATTVLGGAGGAAWLAWLIWIAAVIGVGYLFRKTPGFLLGIGLTLAILAVVGTACAVVIFPRLG